MNSKTIQFWCWIFLLSTVLSCNPAVENSYSIECDKNQIASKYLISAENAKNVLINDKNVILFEVSEPSNFTKEHIPGAQNIWRPDFRTKDSVAVKGTRCSKEELEVLLSSFGTDSKSTLMLYDRKGGVDALRFKWVLDYYGYNNSQVINGGLVAWKKAGFFTTSKIESKRSQSNFKIKDYQNHSILATLQEVKLAIKDTTTLIIDTRALYEYLGQPFIAKNELHLHKKGASISGCIPTSIHLNWSDLADLSDDHRIKCEKDLRYNLEKIGAFPDKKIIVYCQSGSRSSHTAFVLREILGYPYVKNYDGSWIEWSQEHVKTGNVAIEQKTDAKEIERMIVHLENRLKKENG